MPTWSPETWNSFGVVGLVVCMGALLLWMLTSGRLVLGVHHKEIVAGKDAALAEYRERAAVDAETMRDQARVIAGKTGIEDINIKLLQAVREIAEGGR